MSDCCLRLKELMDALSPKEQEIAAFILSSPADVVTMSIKDLAERCNTSMSSVVRLCKVVGYAGYKDLCRNLSTDLAISDKQQAILYSDVRPGDTIEVLVQSVCNSNVRAIENTQSILIPEDIERAVDILCTAKRVDFYGVGASGLVAYDAHNKFIRIRKLSMSSSDPHEQVLTANSLRPGDVAVLISYSGDTRDILETADVVLSTGATLISITRFCKNPLSQKSAISLYTSSSETMIRSGVMGQRIAQLTLIDILYTAVVSKQYAKVRASLDETRLLTGKKHLSS